MREILFRGKRVDNGEWVFGYFFADTADCSAKKEGKCFCAHDGSDVAITFWDDGAHEYNYREVYPDTVGQYIGINDKNNVKIFEGDILRFTNSYTNAEWLCIIEFFEGSYICRYVEEGGHLGEYNRFGSWNEKVTWEVIGNIHDNPELLTL